MPCRLPSYCRLSRSPFRERRLLACIRRQLADENCVRQAAEHRRQAACAPQAKETAPGNTGAVLSLILLVTAETELGKFRLSFLYAYPRHRLAVRPVRPVGRTVRLAADPGIEAARDVCPRRRQPHR